MIFFIHVTCLPGNIEVLQWEIASWSFVDGGIVISQSIAVQFFLDKALKVRKYNENTSSYI